MSLQRLCEIEQYAPRLRCHEILSAEAVVAFLPFSVLNLLVRQHYEYANEAAEIGKVVGSWREIRRREKVREEEQHTIYQDVESDVEIKIILKQSFVEPRIKRRFWLSLLLVDPFSVFLSDERRIHGFDQTAAVHSVGPGQ